MSDEARLGRRLCHDLAARQALGEAPAVQPFQAAAQPARGLSMGEVEARFGTPQEKLDPRGGQKRAWPTINRWSYPAFTVYFERSKVIDVVMNKADADEIGPKPAVR